MNMLKIAATAQAATHLETQREVVSLNPEELTEVSAIVIGTESVNDGTLKAITEKDFGIPVFLCLNPVMICRKKLWVRF